MTDAELIKYMKSPGLITGDNINALNDIVNKYPFFQSAHILLLKMLKESKSLDFQQQLEKSSVYISDRDLLFNFLNREFDHVEIVEETKDLKEKETDSIKSATLLKNKNIKRKINNSFEGMGENISETISSQIEFSEGTKKDKLEYPSEIYFIDEEREGKNNVITIDADPGNIGKLKRNKDILQIDEEKAEKTKKKDLENNESDEFFELIETEEIKEDNKKSNKYFDINQYDEQGNQDLKDDLITKFIQQNPRIEAKEINEEVEDISQESIKEDSNLLSETLIKVYIKQGLFEKAIESYQKLSLKYPEKNAYFASQIKILEQKIN